MKGFKMTFSGEPNEDLTSFLLSFEGYLTLHNYAPSDRIKSGCLRMSLRGEANRTVATISGYEEMVALLRQYYVLHAISLKQQLADIRQMEG